MYKIYFYTDRNGNSLAAEHIRALAGKQDKDSRIKVRKIQEYLNALGEYGLQLREPYREICGS